MSRTLYADSLQEVISPKGFHIEFVLNSSKEKFIVIRNVKVGYRSVICVHPRYNLVTSSIDTVPIEPLSQANESTIYQPLEEEDGIYKDSIHLSNLNVETIMEIERYKKCLVSSQTFGLFFWGNGFIANVWYDHFSAYKVADSPSGTMTIYSMIGVDNIVNWSSKTTDNLKTMIPKFYKILKSVEDANTNSTDEIMKHLRKLREQKSDLNKQIQTLTEELKTTEDMIGEVAKNIEETESELKLNPGLAVSETFRKAKAKELIEKLYNTRDKLFSSRDTITSRISSIHYNLDCVIFFTKKSISDLEKVLVEE